jgi:hypothetical protein
MTTYVMRGEEALLHPNFGEPLRPKFRELTFYEVG